MFTGIIEATGEVVAYEDQGTNRTFRCRVPFLDELRVDQSVSHNGVCLTVAALHDDTYDVVAVEETLRKTNLGDLRPGHVVNLERSMPANGRLDGHFVQGHVDATGVCTLAEDREGSWLYDFEFEAHPEHVLVEKGSIAVNGVSLTVFNVSDRGFRVTIIPYTYEHTTFRTLRPGHRVNLEFDVLGKYVQRLLARTQA
ncbi:MAG: riboflavin synthase [Catalinimonas sp.]